MCDDLGHAGFSASTVVMRPSCSDRREEKLPLSELSDETFGRIVWAIQARGSGGVD